ncbi:unnamed protein product [Caenorhabditis angaria]|uniref:Uncharacterized protein n=1 Tax=Caenorhabditis angaria TaxID=860376 RepID=A0A9P1J256_9PELO|nr:unnamed protein product [Caenorhabditis angaria]
MSNSVDNTPNGQIDSEIAAVLKDMLELKLKAPNAANSADLDALEMKLVGLDINKLSSAQQPLPIQEDIAKMKELVAQFRRDLAKIREEDAKRLQASRHFGF